MPALRRNCTSDEQVAVDRDRLLVERHAAGASRCTGTRAWPSSRPATGAHRRSPAPPPRALASDAARCARSRPQTSSSQATPRKAVLLLDAAVVLVVRGRGTELQRRPTAAAASRPRPPPAARWPPGPRRRAGPGCGRWPRRRSRSSAASSKAFSQSLSTSPPRASARHAGGMRVSLGSACSTTSVCVGGVFSAQPASSAAAIRGVSRISRRTDTASCTRCRSGSRSCAAPRRRCPGW